MALRVAVDQVAVRHRDGYRLQIREDKVELSGGSPAGCFYGLQTLAQLAGTIRYAGATIPSRTPPQRLPAVPCCTIVDWPDFTTRGVLHDVTRGRVPTLGTLKLLVDRLAALKINQLQLYIEHAFVFAFDPEICEPDDGLTPDEVRELDAYCRERFIDLVPALATFGHMGRILSMPKYRHLAEVEATKCWAEMTWPQRMRGLTLDCTSPEAHRLVERMWTDVLDAFSSPVVNICGDEPWDLGQGRNRERFAASGNSVAYIEHIRRTHAICASRGRRTQFWSDVVRRYVALRRSPDLLGRLPSDSTVLHWGYDDQADYEGTGTFTGAGLDTFVCPGTSAWKRIISAMDLAGRNIAAFAAAGRRHGARGLLNTDWGDLGHFNLPACSRHAIALGAALGWAADHPTGRDFDARFAGVALGVNDASGIGFFRRASRTAQPCETWRLLVTPMRSVCDDPSLPAHDEVTELRHWATECRRWCQRVVEPVGPTFQSVKPVGPTFQSVKPQGVAPAEGYIDHDLTELALACRFVELFAEKVAFAHLTRMAPASNPGVRKDGNAWAEKLMEAANAYADCWRARNKPSGLHEILRALSAAADDVRDVLRY